MPIHRTEALESEVPTMLGSKTAPPIGSGAKLREKLLAILTAVALCMSLTPAVAFADDGVNLPVDPLIGVSDAEEGKVNVALTVYDATSGETVLNVAVSVDVEATVADAFAAAGYSETENLADTVAGSNLYHTSYGISPEFLGKTWDEETWSYWATMFDGDGSWPACESAYLAAMVQDGAHYQYVYGSQSSFEYATSNNDAGGEGDMTDYAPSYPYDADKASTLMSNLAARFSLDGADAAISNTTAYAAFALNALDKGASIDVEKVPSNLEGFEESSGYPISAGALAKYIMALENADVDCSAVKINGEEKNLYDEMAPLIADDESIYSQVFILAAYGYCADAAPDAQVDSLVSAIVASQTEDGLWGYAGWEDAQTTSQAILALLPYKDMAGVQVAIDAAVAAVLAGQQADGGFAYRPGEGASSDLDTTAMVVTALAALDYDPNGAKLTTENGSTPVGYLVALADSDLNGYEEAGLWDEGMTAATVLMALAANDGGAGCNVYVVKDVVPSTPSSDTPASSSGKTLAQTGDDVTLYAGAAGVLALGAVCTLMAARRKMAVAQDVREVVSK